ncbi:MarR family transcriptional regulator [Clostridium sp. SHJSY1]|uniref:MarR family winged helix-turn-helix transcriptional regulator n=1 Tax=Clostridium sp. SHJSY1 TaxID=2942483 RepID=UPI00287458E8|nr:MarR family transcriptional regulator [Clostridium sp. SHJSY1]MDS0525254.1 MarR family transcriptional regulator [Clostridium sp. SHJSY1]
MDYNEKLELLHIMQQTFSSLFSVSNKIQVLGDQYCESLTSRQYMTMLAVLHLSEDERSFINIAKKLGTTKQNVTQLIKSLEKKKFVSVIPSIKDKRAVNVSLTDEGMEAVIQCGKDTGLKFVVDLFKEFSKEEIETLWKLLVKLYRFDGVEMDGFEENVQVLDFNLKDESSEILEKCFKESNRE